MSYFLFRDGNGIVTSPGRLRFLCCSRYGQETDGLLDPPTPGTEDLAMAKLVITVEIRPYYVTNFNLGFG